MIDEEKSTQTAEENNGERKKKKYILGGSILLVVIGTVCLATGCFHSPELNTSSMHMDQNRTKPLKPKPTPPDTTKFVKSWNSDIVRLNIKQIKSSNYKIDFSKYKMKKDPQNELKPLLMVERDRLKKLRQQLVSHKDKMYFKPVVTWIDEKLAWGDYNPSKPMTTKELWKYIANIVNPGHGYSTLTTYRIIEINNFCYFFDKYKEKFYSDGYDRNIKTCGQIQDILDEDMIEFKLK